VIRRAGGGHFPYREPKLARPPITTT
jgi:hypothetical protein